MSRKFDRFMVATDNGHNLKLARFTDGEFRALVQGVWPIAAKADPRGAFMIGQTPATADDIVFLAPKVSRRTAAACIAKMRELGMLEHDDELGGEWVHDWDIVNPAPKTDKTNADRQRRFRERRNGVTQTVTDGVSNGAVTPPEVEGEVEDPPSPPGGNGRRGQKPQPPDPDEIPADLAEHLRPVVPAVVAVLSRIAAAKGAKPVTVAATARAIAGHPGHDHLAVAQDVEHWWVHGLGAQKPVKDVVATYRNRLSSLPVGPTGGVVVQHPTAGAPSAAEHIARLKAAQHGLKAASTPTPDGAA